MSEDRLKRLEELQAQAAETLGLPITHEKVQSLAAMRLAHEAIVEKLVHGGGGDHAATSLLNLSEAIDRLSPAPPLVLPKIEVVFVEGVTGIYACSRCGARNELPDGQYTPPSKPKSYPSTIDAEVAKPEPKALPSPIEAKPVHPNDLPRRDPDSIHSTSGARCPPLDYSAIKPEGSYSPLRHVDFDQHHPLPDVPWPEIK